MAKGRVRLDQRLVELGLESTRSRAQARIMAGEVELEGQRLDKAGQLIPADAQPALRSRSPYVSRGGEKLAGALDRFPLKPAGRRCVDVGASTGGFTDCLLQRGASSVLAIDVGYGQLDLKLREDPRVEVLERTNIRYFERPPECLPFELLTADLSFISLRLVLPQLVALVGPGADLLLLVKPQFELERGEVGKGGVVRDPEMQREASARVAEAAQAQGLSLRDECESVLPGPKGNRERFLWLICPE